MARLTRKTMQLFGSQASAGQIGVFGSLAAGGASTSTDPAVIQGLSQWLAGWYAAVTDGESPAIQDMNGVLYVLAYQLCNMLEIGIPAWDSGTTYYAGALVNDGNGQIYVSLADSNLDNVLSDNSYWSLYTQGGTTTQTTTYTALSTDGFVRGNPSSASFTVTLPDISATALNKKYIVKNVASNGNTVTVAGGNSGSDLIDLANTWVLNAMESLTVQNNGTNWDII